MGDVKRRVKRLEERCRPPKAPPHIELVSQEEDDTYTVGDRGMTREEFEAWAETLPPNTTIILLRVVSARDAENDGDGDR